MENILRFNMTSKCVTFICTLLIIYSFLGLVESLCIFGDKPDCYFPCHCAGGSSTSCDALTGKCPQGCKKGKPVIYGDWQGDGCLLGNVAYKKPTYSNTVITKTSSNYNRPALWYNTNYTVDGNMKLRVFDGSCTVVYTANKTTLPWLTVDLQKQYAIPKIILINTDNSIDSSYLEKFYVKIGNTTNMEDQALCKKYYRRIRSAGKETIECDKTLVGRYVTIAKYEERNKVGRLPLCEFVVLGYDRITVEWEKCYENSSNNMFCKKCMGTIPPDCIKECPANSYGMYCEGRCGHCDKSQVCDKITGKCENCELGWKPPKCDVQCPNNTYGYGCANECGKCANNVQCGLESGVCPLGCQLWYASEDMQCKTYIPVQDISQKPEILFVKDTWVMLIIPDTINYQIKNYYKFKIFYLHENNPLANFQEYTNFKIHYGNETKIIKIEIAGLIRHTQYKFVVQIFRQHQNSTEGGSGSPVLNVMTLNRGEKSAGNIIYSSVSSSTNLSHSNTAPTVSTPSLIHRHVSTITIAVCLVIFVIVLTVATGIGVFFYRKHRKNKESNLSHVNMDSNKIVYSSHEGIVGTMDTGECDYYDDLPIIEKDA